MDVDELNSNTESGNGDYDDEFDMNSEEYNNPDLLNIGEAISLLDFVCLYTCVYNMIYLVSFLGSKLLI